MLEILDSTTEKPVNQLNKLENDLHIPEWHKKIVLSRIENSKSFVDAFDMIDNLKQEYSEKV